MTRAALTLSAFAALTAAGLLVPAPAALADRIIPPPPAPSVADAAVEHAMGQVGKPYRYGATGPDAFDCSGLVQWAYREAGAEITRTTYTQFDEGTPVDRADLRPGDLVFFYSGPSHVGMYVGDGRMVHAPSSGKQVQVVDMSVYFDQHFVGGRRIA
ncbi:C40 family peptidase [Nocardiopsis trehalosi]|uniref:C40 family peptidase n=1 Tax=Nocardiopsis trehalosi TaxID=109329 RepID=UPI0009FBDCEF|nr:C40 family peptidase [Nocardiopsis trehalosi]